MKKFFMTLALSVALLLPWAMNAQLTSIDEGFDGGSLPAGWTAAGTMPWTVASGSSNGSGFSGAHGGSGYATASHNVSNTSGTLTSPTIDLSGVTAAYISFWYTNPEWSGDQNVLVVKYSTDGGSTWTNVGTYGTSVTNWTEVTIPIPATDLSSTFTIQFEGQDHWGYAICVDDLFVGAAPSCVAISSLSMAYIGSATATVSWSEMGSATDWNVIVSDSAITDFANAYANPSMDTFFTFMGLTPQTTYYAYVQADCGGGDQSTWRGISFTTTCPEIAHDSLPYIYGFEDAVTGSSGSINQCWDKGTTYSYTDYPYASNDESHSGNNSLYFYYSGTNSYSWAVLPPTEDDVTDLQLSFWVKKSSSSYTGRVRVGVVTDANDMSTFHEFASYTPASSNWEYVELPFGSYNGPNGRVAIATMIPEPGDYNDYSYTYVDDVMLEEIPACPAVASINLEEATTESLTVSWIPNGSENSWLVTCGEDAVVVSDTTYTFQGLDGTTAYEITVAALCADGDTSHVRSEVFRTACPAAVENYSEDFEGFATDVVPDCWQVITHASSSYYPNPCISVDANHAHNGSGLLSLFDDNYFGNATNLIATPRVADISTRQLNFWAKTQSGADPTRFVVGLVNNANAFIPVDTLSLATTYNYFTVNFTDFSDYDTMRIGFMAEKLGGTFHVDIDEVSIIDLPNCLTPSGLAAIDSTLTPNDIELVWNEEGTATAWNIAYSTSPIGDFDTISPESVSYMPYMISNLNPATQYYFYIQADCGGETSPWSPAYVKATPVCSAEEMCSIRFDMVDSYGDGWNGNGIRVKQGAFVLGEVTIASGSSDSAIVRICPNDTVVFEWISGSYPSEVSFNIYDAFGELIYSCTDATSFANGQQIGTFVTSCEAPDCARPMNVVFQSATTSSMTIAWSEMGEATTWNVVWDTLAITDFSNYNTTAAYSNPFTITGLDSNTTYYVYVQADCGGAESEWSAPLVAKTSMCDDICDINVIAAGSTYWWGTSWAASCELVQGGNTVANITSAGEYSLPVCAGDSISIVFTSNGGTNYASYVSLNITDAWDVLLYNKPENSGVIEDAPAAQIATSCVAPTCIKPKFVTFSDITLNDVTVHWFDTIGSAWTVEYGVAGFTPGNGTVVNASADSIQLTGLTPGTRYAVYVTPTCDNTLTSDVAYFATSCVVVNAVPFAENFNTYASGDVPTCWTATQTYVDYTGVQLPAVIAGSYDNYDGSALLVFYGQSESVADTIRNTIALPEFASLAGLQLEFLGMGDGWNITDELYVGVLDTADNFVALDTLHLNSTFDLYTVVLDRYDTLSRRVAFSAAGAGYGEYYYFYIDNLVIDSVPSCFRPEAFAVTGTTPTSVTLSWNEVGQATSWQIAYDTVALNPADCANFETVTTNPYTVTNVVPGVPYTFWVRSICGAGDTSDWCINSVSGAANTWTMHANQTDTITLCGGIIYDCGGPNGTYENNENSTLIILPDAPTNTVRLQGNYNTESNYDKISIYEGVGTSGTCLLNQASGIGTIDYTSTAIGGALTLVFTSDISTVRDGFAFSVSCVSNTCPMVVDLHVIDSTITSGSFDIDWTEAGTAAQWEVVVAEGGNDITTGFSAVTASHPYTVNGLNALSAYDVYVRPICSATDTGDWKSITVGTGMCEDGTTIVLGDDSNYVSNSYAPANCYYNYSYSQTLIKADVLAGLEDGIGAFEFYMSSNSGGNKMTNTQIYMGHVADSNLSGGAIAIDTTFVKVFDGELAYTQGWNRFSFTQKFNWDGQSNVLIVFDRNDGSYASAAYTRVTNTTDVMTLFTYSDNYNIDPANPDSYFGTIYNGNWVPVYHFFACPESGSCARPVVTNVTNDHSNATITWTASGNNFEIEFKPATQGAWADQPVAVQGLTYTFAGLTPETAYQFRLRQVCDDANTSAWVMGSFTTDSLPCFAPSAVTATPAGTSVDLNWTNGGNETQWVVKVWNTAFADSVVVSAKPYTFQNLTSGTQYYAAVAAYCGNGAVVSDWSDAVTFTTTVCTPVTNVAASNVTNSGAKIAWTSNSDAAEWEVTYGTQGFGQGEGTTVTVTAPEYTINGLYAETAYDVYVRAICGTNYISEWSEKVTFTTSNVGINEVSGLNVNIYPNPATTATTITLSGMEGEVEVSIVDMTGRKVMNEKMECAGDCVKTINVDNLAQGAYFVRIQANGTNMVKKLIVK